MLLKMYLANLLIDRKEINFDGCESVQERENYLQALALKFTRKHLKLINRTRDEPVFFLDHVESKMNEEAALMK